VKKHTRYGLLALMHWASLGVAGEIGVIERAGIELHAFVDARGGVRTQADPTQDEESLAEVRLQVDAMRYFDAATLQLRADFLHDGVADSTHIDLERGTGWIDLREANAQLSPWTMVDLKLGRQILTWGVGDLVFINDLFPKDWQAFFIGRDEEYLKAPSDAVLVSFFPEAATIDIAYTPRFDADRFLTGERLSFWSPAGGGDAGDQEVGFAAPDDWFEDDEWAVRVSRTVGSYEAALYGYKGFWKSPAGSHPRTGAALFPALNVYGASVRGQLGQGILTAEAGYYDSREDRDGDDPLIRNGETRLLGGYEREIARDFSGALQYYLEYMHDHDAYRAALPDGQPAADEDRHVVTLRLSKLLMSQNLRLSLFTYYSPSDEDIYFRPYAAYKISDDWFVAAGGNVFLGDKEHTFFGQFEDNSNLYAAVRYHF